MTSRFSGDTDTIASGVLSELSSWSHELQLFLVWLTFLIMSVTDIHFNIIICSESLMKSGEQWSCSSMFRWFAVKSFTLVISLIFISRILDSISWCILVYINFSYIYPSTEHLLRVYYFPLTLRALWIKRWIRMGQGSSEVLQPVGETSV